VSPVASAKWHPYLLDVWARYARLCFTITGQDLSNHVAMREYKERVVQENMLRVRWITDISKGAPAK
jgi:hypothetical protein